MFDRQIYTRQPFQIGPLKNQLFSPGELIDRHSGDGILYELMPDGAGLVDPVDLDIASEFQFQRLER